MKGRCHHPATRDYHLYGGRGIKVCARWEASFEAFLADMGSKPSPQHDAAHSCHNRGCVNPRHLRWATKIENQHDRIGNDTHIRGRKNPNAKLSEADVLAIRSSIDTTRSLAGRFSITPSTVNDIRSGRAWAWLAFTKENHA